VVGHAIVGYAVTRYRVVNRRYGMNDGYVIEATADWADTYKDDDNPVIAHTPDETAYHSASSGAMQQSGMSLGGATMLPRANDDGTSKGNDHEVAGVVCVDPGAPDGGAVVDLSRVDSGTIDLAISKSKGAAHAYYNLSALNQAKEAQIRKQQSQQVNPKMPGYVVPKANAIGVQHQSQPGSQHLGSQPSQIVNPSQYLQGSSQMSNQTPTEPMLLQTAPTAAPVVQAPAVPIQATPPVSTIPQVPLQVGAPVNQPPSQESQAMYGLQNQLSQLSETLSQFMNYQIQQAHLAAASPAPQPQPVEVVVEPKMQTVAELDEAAKSTMKLAGFETLAMPYIVGPLAEKPKKRVIFNMGAQGGTMQSWYHDVIASNGNVVLIYDIRFEFGNQFAPPDQSSAETPTPIRLTCPDMENREFEVLSMGQQFTIGVLDVIVLTEVT